MYQIQIIYQYNHEFSLMFSIMIMNCKLFDSMRIFNIKRLEIKIVLLGI